MMVVTLRNIGQGAARELCVGQLELWTTNGGKTESRLVRNIPFNGSGRGMTKQLFEGKLWTVGDKNNSLKGQTMECLTVLSLNSLL